MNDGLSKYNFCFVARRECKLSQELPGYCDNVKLCKEMLLQLGVRFESKSGKGTVRLNTPLKMIHKDLNENQDTRRTVLSHFASVQESLAGSQSSKSEVYS